MLNYQTVIQTWDFPRTSAGDDKQLWRGRCSQQRPRAVACSQGNQGGAHVSNDGAGGGDRTDSWGSGFLHGMKLEWAGAPFR